MDNQIEYSIISGEPEVILEPLLRSLAQYASNSVKVAIRTTSSTPKAKFNQILEKEYWEKMFVLYKTTDLILKSLRLHHQTVVDH